MNLLRVFGRAYLIVSLTGANVAFIASRQWAAMWLTGVAISFVWWTNSRVANRTDGPLAQWAYAIGAGCGTVTGVWLASHL